MPEYEISIIEENEEEKKKVFLNLVAELKQKKAANERIKQQMRGNRVLSWATKAAKFENFEISMNYFIKDDYKVKILLMSSFPFGNEAFDKSVKPLTGFGKMRILRLELDKKVLVAENAG